MDSLHSTPSTPHVPVSEARELPRPAGKVASRKAPSVLSGLSECMRTAARALFIGSAFMGGARAGQTGSVRFDPPAAGPSSMPSGLESSGLVEQAMGAACGVSQNSFIVMVLDNTHAEPKLVALKTAVAKGAVQGLKNGCWTRAEFHHPVEDVSKVPRDAVKALYTASAAGGQDATRMAQAVREFGTLLESNGIRITTLVGTGARYDLRATISPAVGVRMASLSTFNAASKICPIGPEPGEWHWYEPWRQGHKGDPIEEPITYTLLGATDAFNRAQAQAPTALAYLDSDLDGWDTTREQRRAYWLSRNHGVVELAHAIGQENATMVFPLSMMRAYRNLANRAPGVQVHLPTGQQQAPVHEDLCAYASGNFTAPTVASDPLIENLTRCLYEHGVKTILVAETHGASLNLRLLNAATLGAKAAVGPNGTLAYGQETGRELWPASTNPQKAERIIRRHRANAADMAKVAPDTVQEGRFLEAAAHGLEILPMTLVQAHTDATLAEIVKKPGFKLISLGASHAFEEPSERNRVDQSWRGGDANGTAKFPIPDYLRGPDREAAFERQKGLYGGLKHALQQGPAAAYVNNQVFESAGFSQDAFINWCTNQSWATMVLPLGPDGGSMTLVTTPDVILSCVAP